MLARPEDRLVEWSECLAQVATIELPVTAIRATVIAGKPSSYALILGRRVILWDAGPSGRNDRALTAKGPLLVHDQPCADYGGVHCRPIR